jgi:hypothetical protein
MPDVVRHDDSPVVLKGTATSKEIKTKASGSWPHPLLPSAPSDARASSPALPPAPLPYFWMTCLNVSDSVGYDRCAVKAVLRSLRCHQCSDDIALDDDNWILFVKRQMAKP